jgi:putative heme-binding domain-containing protein
MWGFRLSALLFSAGALLAQHTFSKNDIEDGRMLYEANCARCHGSEGNLVTGVDFSRGKFLRAASDEELVRVIRTGIPAAGMPPGNFSDFRAETIVAYVRYLASTDAKQRIPGDAARGKAIFEGKGGCLSCHRVNGAGSRTGPDLSDIGSQRRFPDQLEKAIVDPAAEILPQNRPVRLVTKDGKTINGRILNHDTFTVQVLDSKEELLSVQRANLKEFTYMDKSPMPSYKDKLSEQEVADVVSYLLSLKGL